MSMLTDDVVRYTAGFFDPFDIIKDVTLDHPSYQLFGHGFMKGKLDWTLLRQLQVVNKAIGNHDYCLSDHKWLSVDVNLQSVAETLTK